MEIQSRRHRTLGLLQKCEDQENLNVIKGKGNLAVPVKKQGLTIRGALGDINTNVPREVITGKVANAAAEYEKKTTLSRGLVNSNYSHVQSKIDTGLATKPVIQPSCRPPLRREESTAGHAARAIARTKSAALKENKQTETKDSNTKKEKKTNKLPSVKENKQVKLKPILKEPTESLGKLKLADETSLLKQSKQSKPMLEVAPFIPDDIEDIDAGESNPFLMSIYIKDIYRYLTELEKKYPIEEDYLKKQNVISGRMRSTLIDWLVEVSQQFSVTLETFHLTVGIVDRYLQAVPVVQRSQLQLVGITAMFIASKYEEIYIQETGDYVYVTDNAYTKQDLFKCERDILAKLGFSLARPIPLSFLRRFVKAAHGTAKNHHLAKYFVDLCLVEYSMVHYRPSELAAAAVCLSLHLLSDKELDEVWTRTLAFYSTYSLDHLLPIIKKIAKIVVNVGNSKHKSVYNKYLDVSLGKVAALPQLNSEAIYDLAQET